MSLSYFGASFCQMRRTRSVSEETVVVVVIVSEYDRWHGWDYLRKLALNQPRIKYYRNKVDRTEAGIPETIAKWREIFGPDSKQPDR